MAAPVDTFYPARKKKADTFEASNMVDSKISNLPMKKRNALLETLRKKELSFVNSQTHLGAMSDRSVDVSSSHSLERFMIQAQASRARYMTHVNHVEEEPSKFTTQELRFQRE